MQLYWHTPFLHETWILFMHNFCGSNAPAMIAERRINLCELLSSGKPCSTIVRLFGMTGKQIRPAKLGRPGQRKTPVLGDESFGDDTVGVV